MSKRFVRVVVYIMIFAMLVLTLTSGLAAFL